MSRHTKDLGEGKKLEYGFCRYLGFFFQVFDIPDENGEEQLIIDECCRVTHLTKPRMIELMKKYELPSTHINTVLMDLPI